LDNNANPFVKDKDDSSVSIAMIQKYDILNKIIEVTGEKKDEAGDTLLHYGAKYGDERTVMRLLDLGFSRQERNTAEQTPYDVAVAWQRPYIADILKL
jgi:ankyrin repeat protein